MNARLANLACMADCPFRHEIMDNQCGDPRVTNCLTRDIAAGTEEPREFKTMGRPEDEDEEEDDDEEADRWAK